MQATSGGEIESIEGVPVTRTVRPATIEAVCEYLSEFSQTGQAVFPVGGGTSLDCGFPPARPGVALVTGDLAQVVDYPHEDMTITVETGIRLATLQQLLAEHNQELPIDVADAHQATLGGLIASNSSGPRRYGHGTLRDYVLGIDVVHADGTRVHGGGRVVKNVAGYDLMKLHTGAWGTLGVIVQVTLKLKPLPEARAAVTVPLQTQQLELVLAHLNRSQTRPVAIEILNGPALNSFPELETDAPFALVLLFEESKPALDWQVQQIQEEVGNLGLEGCRALSRDAYLDLLSRLTHWPRHADANAMFKANLLPGRVASFCHLIEKQLPDASLIAHAGNGIVWVGLPESTTWVQIGHSPLRRFAEDGVGNVIIDRCPTSWKSEAPVWGAPRPDWRLMSKIKQKLDPQNILNPGRFVV